MFIAPLLIRLLRSVRAGCEQAGIQGLTPFPLGVKNSSGLEDIFSFIANNRRTSLFLVNEGSLLARNGVGEKIRSLREHKSLTLAQLSRRARVSASFLSQLEHGTNRASIETLRRIALALEVPLFHFFVDEGEALWVVRPRERKRLSFPRSDADYQLLSPDLNRRMELVLITLEPARPTFSEPFSHPGEECDVVIQGEVRFEIGDRVEILREGDSIYFDCGIPHRFVNVGDISAVIVSAITPPTF
ncbi:MAG: helix-turn-helix transcriptional regulator [Armatimonadetes bacterium]|nr:helix-turn-helix transcriptional regulator [Armatimonadota bacterium]